MKKYRIIARQRIIDPYTKRMHDDKGLMALNGYFEDVITVEDELDRVMFILQFEEVHPEFKGWNWEITEI